jgi:hypothetical protein
MYLRLHAEYMALSVALVALVASMACFAAAQTTTTTAAAKATTTSLEVHYAWRWNNSLSARFGAGFL